VIDLKITYYGNSAFLIEKDGFKGIIDPYIRDNELCESSIEDFKDITHIFVTHGHSDHLGDSVELAMKTGALVIANSEIIRYVESKGVKNVHKQYFGGKFYFDFGYVKMVQALHGSGISENGKVIEGGVAGGFVISFGDFKIYHAGDTGLTYDMKLLESEKIDIAMIPIGGNYTMDIEEAVMAVGFIKPKMVIPMHYIKTPKINFTPEDFRELVKNAKVIIVDNNGTIRF
jgi:L-ascorbate metabolism protein UlaG (beta-lactamase superfamily)